MQLVGFRSLQLDSRDSTVRYDKPGVEIDLGGIGKGFALDRAVAWKEAKFEPEDAFEWREAGFSLETSIENRDKGLSPIK